MTSERRASIRPPEMMNGSTNGSVSSNSSARAMRTGRDVEEMQRTVTSLELTCSFELEHCDDEAVARVKHQRVQRPLGARAAGRAVLEERKLEKRVELHALAAAPGVVHDQAAGADVSGAAQPREPRALPREPVKHPQVPLAQVPASVRDTAFGVERSEERRVGKECRS